MPGTCISEVEVIAITGQGIRMRIHGRERFLSYEDFPWFNGKPEASVRRVEEPSPGHLYWPDLDIDLGLETIEHPERFPLVSARP